MNITDRQKLLEALDMKDLPPEEQEQILLDFGDLVFRNSMLRLIESCDDKTRADLDSLLATDPTEDQVIDFMMTRMPGADQAVEETLAELRGDILAVTGT